MSEPRPSRSTGRLSRLEVVLLILGAALFGLSLYLYSRPAPDSSRTTGSAPPRDNSQAPITTRAEENANILVEALNAYFAAERKYPAFLVGGSSYEHTYGDLTDPLAVGGFLEEYPLRTPASSHRVLPVDYDDYIRNLYAPRGTELFEALALQARPVEPPKPHEPTPPSWTSSLESGLPSDSPYYAFGRFEPKPASIVRQSPIVISASLYMSSFVRRDANPSIERLTVNGTRINGKVTLENNYFLITSEPYEPTKSGFQHVYLTIDDRHEYFRYRYTRTWDFTFDDTAAAEQVQEWNDSPSVLQSRELMLEDGMVKQMERNTEHARSFYEEEYAARKADKERYERMKEEYPAKMAEYERQMTAYREKLRLWQKLEQVPAIVCAGGIGYRSSGEHAASQRFAYSMLPKGPEAVFAGTGRRINTVQTPHGHFGYARGDSVGGDKDTAVFWMYGEDTAADDNLSTYEHPEPFGLDILNAETGELVPDGIPDGVVLFCKLQNGEVAEITRAEESDLPSG
jgi:hypothetical protein